jgi:hypothetical protein
MALVYDGFLQRWYDIAVGSPEEHNAMSFWNYLWNQYFHEKHFFYDREKPASRQDSRRRVDGVMTYMEKDTIEPRVLFFHEAKKAGQTDSQVRDVEGQAFEACGTYLQSRPEFTHVYAVTTIGTEARVWKASLLEDGFQSLVDDHPPGIRSAYIDAKSTDSKKLVQAINHMKQFPPSAYATAAPIPTQPALPDSDWTWSAEYQDHYRVQDGKYYWSKSSDTPALPDSDWTWSAEHQDHYRVQDGNYYWRKLSR